MLSLQELSDRVELEQLSVRYANAIDSGNWDELDQVVPEGRPRLVGRIKQ